MKAFWTQWRQWWQDRRPRSAETRDAPGSQDGLEADTTPEAERHEVLVETLIRQQRMALLVRPQLAPTLQPEHRKRALEAIDRTMAVVPAGDVCVPAVFQREADRSTGAVVPVEGLMLDRHAVTCEAFQQFVDAGGYEEMNLWDDDVWPMVFQFVDRTGYPGPAGWKNGRFPEGMAQHPVVGVSWYEALAYARWVGKRLPTLPEWIKAAAWPVALPGGVPSQRRFPWGDVMERSRAHLWSPQSRGTVAVDALPASHSVGGIEQLTGNVWEWTRSPYAHWEAAARHLDPDYPLKAICGGSYLTYFDHQASCGFHSGEPPLSRRDNIGFRCALSLCDIAVVDPEPFAGSAPARAAGPVPVETTS